MSLAFYQGEDLKLMRFRLKRSDWRKRCIEFDKPNINPWTKIGDIDVRAKFLKAIMAELTITCLMLLFSNFIAVISAAEATDPNRILQDSVPEIPGLVVPPAKDLEPNPHGKYRRYTFIQGDFNKDGRDDVAICAVDNPDWTKRSADSYVLIVSKTKDRAWIRVFFEKIPGVRHPFLIWDDRNKALLVGANYSDYNPGDILWDPKANRYRLVAAKN